MGQGEARRRVLMITYHFPPAVEMGAQACAQISRYLPLYGWEAVVLAARERYLGRLDAASPPAPALTTVRTSVLPHPFWLYRRLKSVLGRNGRTASSGLGSAKAGVLRRWLLSLLAIPDEYTGWILPAVTTGSLVARRYGVECIFSSGPFWTNHLAGLATAKLTKLPWVAHFRDPWTQAEWWKPVSTLSLNIEAALERAVIRETCAVVCVTEQHTALLRRTYPELPAGKFMTIPNGYDGAEWETAAPEPRGAPERATFVITYAGTLYQRRNPLPLFRALRSLIGSGEIPGERVRVDLIGQCDEAAGARLADMVADCELTERVNITGPLRRAETLRRMAQSSLLLLLAEGLTHQIPGKTYEYLRAGRPILALTAAGAVAELLQNAGGAWIVDPDDVPGIRAAVLEAYRCWSNGVDGARPNPTVVASFDRRVLAARFAEVLDRTTRGEYVEYAPGTGVSSAANMKT